MNQEHESTTWSWSNEMIKRLDRFYETAKRTDLMLINEFRDSIHGIIEVRRKLGTTKVVDLFTFLQAMMEQLRSPEELEQEHHDAHNLKRALASMNFTTLQELAKDLWEKKTLQEIAQKYASVRKSTPKYVPSDQDIHDS